jgi:hypothetical protein
MPEDIESIKKLPAEERLKKLKEFSKKREDEIKTAQDMMRRSESELKDEKETEEKIPIPQMISDRIEELTTKEERDMFNVHRQTVGREEKEEQKPQRRTIEETVEAEAIKQQITPAQIDYMRMEEASRRPVHEFYAEIGQIKTNVEQQGYISPQQTARVEYITHAIEIKERSGYKPEHEAVREATLTQKMGAQLQNMYKAQSAAPEKLKSGYQFTEDES